MKTTRMLLLAGGLTAMIATLAFVEPAVVTGAVQAPRFEVDPMWPRPLPNHWVVGSATGIAIDARDHIFVVHLTDSFAPRTETGLAQTPPSAECCRPAPNVLEFDVTGKLVGHWGGAGPGYEWPTANSGLSIDDKGNVWIGGGGHDDHHMLAFTSAGKFLMQVGKTGTAMLASRPVDTSYAAPVQQGGRGTAARVGGAVSERSGCGGGAVAPTRPDSRGTTAFGGATQIAVDAGANEGFVADGCRNHRIAVIDLKTGAIKRFFGAYGTAPDDAAAAPYTAGSVPKQFGAVTCAEFANDGLLYVCDRTNDRVQVFRKNGTFVKEKSLAVKTLADGSVWDVAFSRDPQQKYLYVADGMNARIHVLDRLSLEHLTSFGTGGRQPGQFLGVSGVATDSKGNLYTVEAFEGKRIQKFTFKGVGAIAAADQGTLWPRSAR